MTQPRYKKGDGWLTLRLPLDTNAKLREIAAKTGLKMTTIIVQGIGHEWREWSARWNETAKVGGVE